MRVREAQHSNSNTEDEHNATHIALIAHTMHPQIPYRGLRVWICIWLKPSAFTLHAFPPHRMHNSAGTHGTVQQCVPCLCVCALLVCFMRSRTFIAACAYSACSRFTFPFACSILSRL